MKLLEHEAKSILKQYGVPVPESSLIKPGTSASILAPVVLKSQVHSGGRGKAGGIRIIQNDTDIQTTIDTLFLLDIKGERPSSILAEELIDIKKELYLSLTINRERATIELLANKNGGVEVEDNTNESFFRLDLTEKLRSNTGEVLAEYFELSKSADDLQKILDCCIECFVSEDATLLEINPLVFTKNGAFVAADCKMELDGDASFRHPERNFASVAADTTFVPLNENGTIATIANGAGLAMATVDAVQAAGYTPANFLDIGGGATTESIIASFEKIMKNPNITHIVINIFGGIVQCDVVAAAIIEAREKFDHLPKLHIRLTGTNANEARDILDKQGIRLYDTLSDALEDIS